MRVRVHCRTEGIRAPFVEDSFEERTAVDVDPHG